MSMCRLPDKHYHSYSFSLVLLLTRLAFDLLPIEQGLRNKTCVRRYPIQQCMLLSSKKTLSAISAFCLVDLPCTEDSMECQLVAFRLLSYSLVTMRIIGSSTTTMKRNESLRSTWAHSLILTNGVSLHPRRLVKLSINYHCANFLSRRCVMCKSFEKWFEQEEEDGCCSRGEETRGRSLVPCQKRESYQLANWFKVSQRPRARERREKNS